MPSRFPFPILLLPLLALLACIPPGEAEPTGVVVDPNDPVAQHIYNLQNDRRADSLLTYLAAEHAGHRYLAATALGSFPSLEPAVVDSLATALADPESLVRTAAAYALGQSGQPRAAELLAANFDRSGRYREYNAAVLAAVGKTGDAEDLEHLLGIQTYEATDTALLAGRAWGLYYFALRELIDPRGTASLIEQVTDRSAAPAVRYPAAHYLHRMAVVPDTGQEVALRELLRNERDPIIAMGVIRALGRSGLPAARVALLRRLESSGDWRERTEILRALGEYSYPVVRETVVEALRDPHPLVARTAADFLVANGTEADALFYRQLAQDSFPPAIRTRLYRAANRHLSPYLTDYRDRITYALRRAYDTTSDPYERADLIRALGEFPWLYRVIYDLYNLSPSPVVRSAAAETLAGISGRDDFAAFFRSSTRRVRSELATYFRAMISSREVGPAYHAANALAAGADRYRPYYPDRTWLRTTLENFALPKEIETYTAVAAARARLEEREPEPVPTTARARPIDWNLLLGSGNKEVVLRTPAGRIVLRLWPQMAPATVSSFLELVGRAYYDGRVFHRVVPNFVAQGGGPRGDGFGGEDFVIRTETPLGHWDRAGLVGMASAGRDTEGVQFFITHRPTPHLDGKYTIFGEVTEGQEIVDRLEPGARIESIQLR